MSLRLPNVDEVSRSTPRPSILGQVQGFSGMPAPRPSSLIEAPDVTSYVSKGGTALARGVESLGQNISRASDSLYAMQQREQDRMDQLRTEEAYNKVLNAKLDLTMGEKGYTKLQGSDAINRKTSLVDEYPKSLSNAIANISSSLSNDNQRAKFKSMTDTVQLGFKTDVMRHLLGQEEQFKKDTYAGVVDTEQRAAMVDWSSPSTIDKSKMRIRAVTEASMEGKPRELIETAVVDAYQKINSAVISQAIAAGQLDYAQQFLKNNNAAIDTSDMIRYSSAIENAQNKALADRAIQQATAGLEQRFEPNDKDRLLSLLVHAESRGRDYDQEGKLLSSSKGALGRFQVMPATAKKPGFGIEPARDNSPEEYARVGEQYFGAMLASYGGNIGKALAAYNAGPDVVNKAIKKAEVYSQPTPQRAAEGFKTYLNFLPEETQKYVTNILKNYTEGVSYVEKPTINDIKKNVELALPGLSRDVVEAAQSKAEALFNDTKQSAKQKSEDALTSAKQRFDSGEIVGWGDLSPTDKMLIGDNRAAFYHYISAELDREDKALEKSPAAVTMKYALAAAPEKLTAMQVPEIMALAPDLGQKAVNQLLEKRANFINNPKAERDATIDSTQFNVMAANFGFHGKSDSDKLELLKLRDKAENLIIDAQTTEKRNLTREEKDNILKNLFVEYPSVKIGERPSSWGVREMIFGRDITETKRGYAINPGEQIVVPEDTRAQITGLFVSKGITPTEQDILNTYTIMLIQQRGG